MFLHWFYVICHILFIKMIYLVWFYCTNYLRIYSYFSSWFSTLELVKLLLNWERRKETSGTTIWIQNCKLYSEYCFFMSRWTNFLNFNHQLK